MAELGPGSELDGCRIIEQLGRGGMGVVYRARQLELDRDVAVKVISPDRVADDAARRRFLSEARAAAAVEHPNVLPVYGAGLAGEHAYIVMRYVPGDDLRVLVRLRGPLEPEHAAAIAAPPVLVAADAHNIWVAGQRRGSTPDLLYRYTADGTLTGSKPVAGDIRALITGGGRAWVAHDGSSELVGFDPALHLVRRSPLRYPAKHLAFGGGRVWASEPIGSTLGRYDPRRRSIHEFDSPSDPAGLAFAAGRLFLASSNGSELHVLDPGSIKDTVRPIAMPGNPFAVAMGVGHVWVTGTARNSLSRIDY